DHGHEAHCCRDDIGCAFAGLIREATAVSIEATLDEGNTRGAVTALTAEVLQGPQRRRGGAQALRSLAGGGTEGAALHLEVLQILNGLCFLLGALPPCGNETEQKDQVRHCCTFHGITLRPWSTRAGSGALLL